MALLAAAGITFGVFDRVVSISEPQRSQLAAVSKKSQPSAPKVVVATAIPAR
jgi:hypothetical protein